MTRLTTLFLSIILAAVTAVGVGAVEPSTAAAADTYAPKCGGGKILLAAKEHQMFKLHNKTRINRDLPRLCVHPALQKAARAHSKDMIARDYFSHDTKGTNEEFSDRLIRYGYRWRIAAENLALGSGAKGAPGDRFQAWMKSPSHKPNILDRRFREIGIGAATGTYQGTANTTIYTADFGAR